MAELEEYTILGRLLGYATGWDQADDWAIYLYNFEPAEGVPLPKCPTLFISYDTGSLIPQNDDGDAEWGVRDLVEFCGKLPRCNI